MSILPPSWQTREFSILNQTVKDFFVCFSIGFFRLYYGSGCNGSSLYNGHPWAKKKSVAVCTCNREMAAL